MVMIRKVQHFSLEQKSQKQTHLDDVYIDILHAIGQSYCFMLSWLLDMPSPPFYKRLANLKFSKLLINYA